MEANSAPRLAYEYGCGDRMATAADAGACMTIPDDPDVNPDRVACLAASRVASACAIASFARAS